LKGEHVKMERETLLDLLDEALEIVEMHPRNSLNLCLCGGLEVLLDIVLNNEIEEVRRTACGMLSYALSNNKEVQ